MSDFTHFNEQGRAHMVDVSGKGESVREAVAVGRILMHADTLARVRGGSMKKGDVLAVAQVAGIQAAKHCWEMIPMCHQVPLSAVDIAFELTETAIEIRATAKCSGATGVEMEALSAVSVAALTVYDMCKAVQKDMRIEGIHLLSKSGGKRGDYFAEV